MIAVPSPDTCDLLCRDLPRAEPLSPDGKMGLYELTEAGAALLAVVLPGAEVPV